MNHISLSYPNTIPTNTAETLQNQPDPPLYFSSILPTKIHEGKYSGSSYLQQRTQKALNTSVEYLNKLGSISVAQNTVVENGDTLVAIRTKITDHGYFILINSTHNNKITNAEILDLAGGKHGEAMEHYGYLESSGGTLYPMQLIQASEDDLQKFNKVLAASTKETPNFYLIKKGICSHNDLRNSAQECAKQLTKPNEKLFNNFRGRYSIYYNCNHFVYNIVKKLYNDNKGHFMNI